MDKTVDKITYNSGYWRLYQPPNIFWGLNLWWYVVSRWSTCLWPFSDQGTTPPKIGPKLTKHVSGHQARICGTMWINMSIESMIKLRQHPQTQHASEPSNGIQRTVWRAGIYPKSQQNREVLVEHPPIIRETEGSLTLKHLNNTFKALTAKNVWLRKKRKGYWYGPLKGSKILKSPCVHQPAGGCRLHVGAWFAKQLVCVRIEPLQFTVNLGQVHSWHWASRVFMVGIAQKPHESLGKSPKYI